MILSSKKIQITLILALSLVWILHGVSAGTDEKTTDPSLLNLERIFKTSEFQGKRFGPARWLEFMNGYTTLEPAGAKKKGQDIVRYDPASGRKAVLVAAEQLIPAGGKEPLEIEDYHWSRNGEKLLIFTHTARVWRQNTRGDYWVLNRKTAKLEKIGGDAEPSTLMFAKFSPDAGRIAYVRKNNLYVEDLSTHRITQLTRDGSETLINGTFDWVYEEEFGLRDGFRWSPDGRRIAYWQLDASGIPLFHMINTTDSLYPRLLPIPYPKPGETNPASRIGVVPADGGATRWFAPPGDPRQHYQARLDWAGNSREICFQRLNRRQNTNWVMIADTDTGDLRTVFTDTDPAWVDVGDDLQWLSGGRHFTFVSEQSGWRHLYLISRDGRQKKDLTPGNYDLIGLDHIDEKGGWAYFTASPDQAGQRYLYRVKLDGSGKRQRVTPETMPGTHSYQISPDGGWAFHTHSRFADPPLIDLVRLPGHRTVRSLEENAALREKVAALDKSPVEFFRIDIGGGLLLDGWCLKPPDFSPQKRYPVLFQVYGEPAGQTVLDRWGGRGYLWHLMLAQRGCIVMSIDNRGTPAPRGREWRKCVYGKIGITASEDQAAALRALLKERPYLDAKRIGIWGWSGGGSMTLNMMFRYPDLYKTGLAVAFVADQRLYDSIYQERYMGLPGDNPDGYRDGSPITFARQLQGDLLLVHGTGDDNVHYQNCERLVNELVKHNKPFTMMAYPNRSHGIYEGENTTLHLYTLLTKFLEDHLPLQDN